MLTSSSQGWRFPKHGLKDGQFVPMASAGVFTVPGKEKIEIMSSSTLECHQQRHPSYYGNMCVV